MPVSSVFARARLHVAIVLLSLMRVAALGAQAPIDSTRADSSRTRAVLAPVTVTAAGPALALPRVPFAISIREPRGAERAVVPISLEEPLRGIAGLQLDNRHNIALGERISIRGFGARTQFGVRGVRIDVDGIPATMPDGQTTLSHVDASTVRRVEVLRGAASASHGNAAGGYIALGTHRTDGRASDPSAGLAVSERATTTARVEVGGGSGAWVASARVSDLRYEGFRQNSDARDLRAGARVARSGHRDTLALVIAGARYDADNPGGLTDSARTADPRSASATNLRFRTGEAGKQLQAGVSWRHRGVTSYETSAYALIRDVDNPIPMRIVDLERRAAGLRFRIDRTLQLASREGGIAFGVEHAQQRDERRNYTSIDGARGTIVLDQGEEVRNSGAHARMSLLLSPALHLLAALRGDLITFDVRDRMTAGGDADDSGDRTMRAISPSAGVSYVLGERANIYANFSTAFETPTTSELANRPSGAGGMNDDLQPQRVRSFEVGVRADARAGFRGSVAAFDARVSDGLVPFELATTPGRQFYRNAARLRHRGVEVEASAALATGWRFTAAATLIDARVVRDTAAAGSREGRRVPGVAPARVDMELAGPSCGPLLVALVGRAQSRSPADDVNASWSPGYLVTDVRLMAERWMVGGVELTPALVVANVLDTPYDASIVANAARGRYFEPGPGRTITVSMSAAWRPSRTPIGSHGKRGADFRIR